MVKKVFEKAGLIPGLQLGTRAPAVPEAGKPRTAPGTMLGFLSAQSSAIQEAEDLKERVRVLEGEGPLRKLDPETVGASKWANRHEASFQTEEFAALKAEIAAAGGNVQPIKVRPSKVLNGSTLESTTQFELVFGHRRHRACLELGLPVLAAVEELTDQALFEQMERENRGRKNLSAWEQGVMYRKALDEGLYPSLRRLAEGLDVDVSLVSKSVALARLPDRVVGAFRTPLEIQFRWASALSEAVQKDPEGVLARAKALSDQGDKRPGASAVLASLLATESPDAGPAPIVVHRGGKKAATIKADARGRATVQFEVGVLPDSKRKALAKLLEDFLKI